MSGYTFSTNENIKWHEGEITYEDRCSLLQQKGLVVWFTGLSGAGKSTIAVEVEKRLISMGKLAYRLDGDNVRHGLNSDLGFSEEDRNENIRRIAEVAVLFKDTGIITLVSTISPYIKMREFAREKIGKENFIEAYIKASIQECVKRDPKGLYKKAQSGEIMNFTGLDSVYEESTTSDIIIDTESTCIEEAVKVILNEILCR